MNEKKASPAISRVPVVRRLFGVLGDNVFIRFMGRLVYQKLPAVGLVFVLIIVVGAIFGPVLYTRDPLKQNALHTLEGPSRSYVMGTDYAGRDVLARLLHGARASLTVGIGAVGIAIAIGVPLGLVAGYYGKYVDEVIMRFFDAWYAMPGILLAIAIVMAIGSGIHAVTVAIGLTTVPVFVRIVRGQTLSLKEQDFVLAVRAVGGSNLRIMAKHIWPNATAPVIVQGSLAMGFAVVSEAGLSFLGIGIKPPIPTWGGMLRTGFDYIFQDPMLSIIPGIAIMMLVLGFNFVGDGLRDVFDPQLGLYFRKRSKVSAPPSPKGVA